MIVAARTDTGKVRQRNEDYYHIPENGRDKVVAVADGLGGHNCGDLASSLSVLCALAALQRMENVYDAPGAKLRRAIRIANDLVYRKSQEDEQFHGMGSTLTMAILLDGRAVIGHVGDSRAYLYRDGALQRITRDHSLFDDMVANGDIDGSCASHPAKHVLTRAVGTGSTVDVDTYMTAFGDGDILLLCTDGLHGAVCEPDIERVLSGCTLEQAADTLLQKALDAGGRDNITLVLVQNDGEGGEDA